jgi:hypothetical protein
LSEIWREIGATYLAANMLNEAREALEKFVERRAFDPEGLYISARFSKRRAKAIKRGKCSSKQSNRRAARRTFAAAS